MWVCVGSDPASTFLLWSPFFFPAINLNGDFQGFVWFGEHRRRAVLLQRCIESSKTEMVEQRRKFRLRATRSNCRNKGHFWKMQHLWTNRLMMGLGAKCWICMVLSMRHYCFFKVWLFFLDLSCLWIQGKVFVVIWMGALIWKRGCKRIGPIYTRLSGEADPRNQTQQRFYTAWGRFMASVFYSFTSLFWFRLFCFVLFVHLMTSNAFSPNKSSDWFSIAWWCFACPRCQSLFSARRDRSSYYVHRHERKSRKHKAYVSAIISDRDAWLEITSAFLCVLFKYLRHFL